MLATKPVQKFSGSKFTVDDLLCNGKSAMIENPASQGDISLNANFFENALTVSRNRLKASSKFRGDVLHRVASNQQFQHFIFLVGQLFQFDFCVLLRKFHFASLLAGSQTLLDPRN